MAKTKKRPQKKPPEKKGETPKTTTLSRNDKIVIAVLIGSIILVVGLVITLRYFMKSEEVIEKGTLRPYNGFSFELRENYWFSDVQRNDGTHFELTFYYHPEDTLDIGVEDSVKPLIVTSSKLVITLDPDLPSKAVIGGTEVSKILGKIYGKNVVAALTQDVGVQAPTAGCHNTTDTTKVILLNITDSNRIYEKDGCILVEGSTPDELIRASDRLAYHLLGIIP